MNITGGIWMTIIVKKSGLFVDCTTEKDIAYPNRKPERVEFCLNWCKRCKKCGTLFDHFCTGIDKCDLYKLKKYVRKPVKISGVKDGKFIFVPATKDEVNQMLLEMPIKEKSIFVTESSDHHIYKDEEQNNVWDKEIKPIGGNLILHPIRHVDGDQVKS